MKLHRHALRVATRGRETREITAQVQAAVASTGIERGMAHLFVHHTSCSLLINENADPDVRRDLETFLSRLVPDGDSDFVHTAEGPDDMPSHVRTALTATSLSLPIEGGRCDLGTWQGIYLYEHRLQPHERRVTLSVWSGDD